MSQPSYLTRQQVDQLLAPIKAHRVHTRDGLSHVEAYDIRAHLNRIFGFGRWSGDVLSVDVLYEAETTTKQGKPAYAVAYRCTYRLTVCAPDGTTLATYTEVATGDALMPDFKRGDAHDFAVKSAESQALKRCAANLGDQFGLSLYNQGSLAPLVKGTLVAPDQAEQEPSDVQEGTPEVAPEAVPVSSAVEVAPPTPPQPTETKTPANVAALRDRAINAETRQQLTQVMKEAAGARLINEQTADANGAVVTLGALISTRLNEITRPAQGGQDRAAGVA